jgi:hypothetical protein
MDIRGNSLLLFFVGILCGCGGESEKYPHPQPSTLQSYGNLTGIVQPLPYRTPEETLIASYKAFDEHDSVTTVRLNGAGRNQLERITWTTFQKKKAGKLHLLKNIEVEYSPDSIECMVYYDKLLIDSASKKIVKTDRDCSDLMFKDDGIWKFGSLNEDDQMPEEVQDQFKNIFRKMDSTEAATGTSKR